MGYDIIVCISGADNYIGVRERATNTTSKVPMTYSPAAKAWIMQVVASEDADACATAVRRILNKVDKHQTREWWSHRGGDKHWLTPPLNIDAGKSLPMTRSAAPGGQARVASYVLHCVSLYYCARTYMTLY